MLQYLYCGSVDIDDCEVEEFRKTLGSLRIEFVQEDLQDDESGENEEVEEIETVKPEPEESEVIVEVASCSNFVAVAKKEPKKESTASTSSGKSNLSGERSELHEKVINFRRIIPSRIRIRESNIKSKVSLARVVPSKSTQEFMNRNITTCPFCRKIFKTSKHRNEHVKFCFDNPDRIVSECHLCHKSVCDPYYLRKHMRKVHAIDSTLND